MAISLERLARSVLTKKETQTLPQRFNNGEVFGDHKKIFEHYGIDYNTIDPTQVTRFDTVDGELCVFGPQCTISPPPGYNSTLLRSDLVRS